MNASLVPETPEWPWVSFMSRYHLLEGILQCRGVVVGTHVVVPGVGTLAGRDDCHHLYQTQTELNIIQVNMIKVNIIEVNILSSQACTAVFLYVVLLYPIPHHS